jgi:translation initiation factor 1 (eIF-1/SUI1)
MALVENETEEQIETTTTEVEGNLYIKFILRNGKKGWTTISGLKHLNLDAEVKLNFIKKIKKSLGTSASIDKETGILNIQGDHRDHIKDLIIDNLGLGEDNIIFG